MSAPAYAVVANGAVVEYRSTAPNVDQSLLAPGKPRMLPVIEDRPAYDQASEALDGPDTIVGATQVTKRWTKRAKTQAEIGGMIASVDEKNRKGI
jgi:hypothetical protein